MMFAIEFQAHIRDGIIEIPESYREAVFAQINDAPVHVILLAPEQIQTTLPLQKDIVKDADEKGYDNVVEYLLDNPLQISDFRPLTREEIYDRRNF
jgi:hypothetical protein